MLSIISIIIGILAGIFIPYNIPSNITPYVAIAILAALDTVFGGMVAEIKGVFDIKTFVSVFFGNAILAAALVFAGKRIGLDLSLAAIVVFGTRLFNNFSRIRQDILQKHSKKVRIRKVDLIEQHSSTNFED